MFSAADGKMAADIVGSLEIGEARRRLNRYYTEDLWFTRDGRSLKGFRGHIDELAGGNGNRVFQAPRRRCPECGFEIVGSMTHCTTCDLEMNLIDNEGQHRAESN